MRPTSRHAAAAAAATIVAPGEGGAASPDADPPRLQTILEEGPPPSLLPLQDRVNAADNDIASCEESHVRLLAETEHCEAEVAALARQTEMMYTNHTLDFKKRDRPHVRKLAHFEDNVGLSEEQSQLCAFQRHLRDVPTRPDELRHVYMPMLSFRVSHRLI